MSGRGNEQREGCPFKLAIPQLTVSIKALLEKLSFIGQSGFFHLTLRYLALFVIAPVLLPISRVQLMSLMPFLPLPLKKALLCTRSMGSS